MLNFKLVILFFREFAFAANTVSKLEPESVVTAGHKLFAASLLVASGNDGDSCFEASFVGFVALDT